MTIGHALLGIGFTAFILLGSVAAWSLLGSSSVNVSLTVNLSGIPSGQVIRLAYSDETPGSNSTFQYSDITGGSARISVQKSHTYYIRFIKYDGSPVVYRNDGSQLTGEWINLFESQSISRSYVDGGGITRRGGCSSC